MLKPIIKEPSVNESERILAKVAEKTFFSLWSYPSLFRDVDNGKELVDLTVYFNNTLILFSDKGEVVFQHDRPVELAWSRWYRAAIKESAKQLHGAESFIRKHPNRIFLNQKCEENFPFDVSHPDLKIHLVCVTRGIGGAAKSHYDSVAEGSRGTLSSFFPLSGSEVMLRPFYVNDVDPAKTFVHVLDETGIDLLLTELATPSDFIRYLESKERAVRNLKLISAGGEEDILAYYLENDDIHGYGAIKNPRRDYSVPFMIHETHWTSFRNSPSYALHYSQRKSGDGWSAFLKRFSDSIIDATVGEGHDRPLLEHAKVVEILASENMRSRSHLWESLYAKYETVPEFVRSARVVKSLCHPDRMYIFLFFPWDDEFKDYDEYRAARLNCAIAYGLVAMYKYQDAKAIVVIGMATKGETPGSETVIAFDASKPLDPEERAEAQKIMRFDNILYDIIEKKSKASDFGLKIGRNETCPCGSGKKFKKCCE